MMNTQKDFILDVARDQKDNIVEWTYRLKTTFNAAKQKRTEILKAKKG
jgi:hypothetical protein